MTASAAGVAVPRSLPANTGFALFADIAAKAGALVVLVVAARFLSARELAVLGVALAISTILAAAIDAGVSTLLARDGAAAPDEGTALLQAALRGRLLLGLLAMPLVVAAGWWMGRPLTAALTVALGAIGAATLSVLGALRAAQDLRHEAVARAVVATTSVALVAMALSVQRDADAVLMGIVGSAALGILLLRPALSRLPRSSIRHSALAVLRRAAPLGVIGLVTLAYYRAPTVLLGALAPAHETAAFTIAASVGFGLLAVPNAVTTGLLPRLSSRRAATDHLAATRRALMWTTAIGVAVGCLAAAVAPWGIPAVFGTAGADAVAPFMVLTLSVPLIAASGIIGTALVARREIRALTTQTCLALGFNLAACAVVLPWAGAMGAAWATVATEFVALAILLVAARRNIPGLWGRRVELAAAVARQRHP